MATGIRHATHINMGIKRSVWTSGMQSSMIFVLQCQFNGSKTDFINFCNFPLYFWKFPLYKLWGQRETFPCSQRSEIFFGNSQAILEWENAACSFKSPTLVFLNPPTVSHSSMIHCKMVPLSVIVLWFTIRWSHCQPQFNGSL